MTSLGCQKGGTTVMEKDRTKAPVADPIFPSLTPASTSRLLLRRAVLDTRLALRDFLLAAGLQELRKAFEEDRTLLCGPKGKVQTDRRAYRHGHDVGELVLGGRKARIAKPGASRFWESLKAAARARRWARVCSRTSLGAVWSSNAPGCL